MKRLTPPVVAGVRTILESFLQYQNAAFQERSPEFFCLELCGECGELANLEKKLWRDSLCGVPSKRLAEEAADVGIALINYCNARGIDLEDAMATKLLEIEERRVSGKMGPVKNSHTTDNSLNRKET